MDSSTNNTPVLLIVFNRPDKVKRLITALAEIKPREVYIAADGPRSHKAADAELCEETRKLVSTLPWECNIHTNFQEKNLGCKIGVSTAISWFFTKVEEGMILEDDCIPTPSFFTYCTENLKRYRGNEKVMHISGSTFIKHNQKTHPNDSYYFSQISLIWGWATWRRAWEKYDIEMSDISGLSKTLKEKNTFGAQRYRHHWITLFKHLKDARIDTWDGQWLYTILRNDGICLTPAHNLIQNIGFDKDATHTTEAVSFAQGVSELSFPMTHPNQLKVDEYADTNTMKTAFVNTFKKHLKYHIRSILNL